MSETATAKLFMHGRSQAVRLPKAFRLPGTEVRVSRSGSAVILEPLVADADHVDPIFEEIHRLAELHGEFLPEGRQQPPMPPDDPTETFE